MAIKENATIKCATDLTKQAFDCTTVVSSDSMHELRELVKTVNYVRNG